jgi:lysophospholipase L1-like esterase
VTGRRLATAALVAAGLLAGLAAAELALRLWPVGPRGRELRLLHEVHPGRPWLYGLRPGADVQLAVSGAVHYRINADGFRGPRAPIPKPPGRHRVLVLGDSIAFGYGVDEAEAFPRQLERRLAAVPGAPALDVVNLGVNGYNAYTEAALYEDVGARYAPDLVLVQFCVNDLNDPTLHFDASTVARLGAIPPDAFPDPARHRVVPWPARLCRALRTCALVAERAGRGDGAALLDALAPHTTPSPGELAWLRRQYDAIARRAGRLVVVVFPYESQLQGRAGDDVQRALGALARDAGWDVVDLLPAYRAAAAGGEPLFIDIWHPTAAGQRVAAAEIARQLRCRGLVPLPPDADCQ